MWDGGPRICRSKIRSLYKKSSPLGELYMLNKGDKDTTEYTILELSVYPVS